MKGYSVDGMEDRGCSHYVCRHAVAIHANYLGGRLRRDLEMAHQGQRQPNKAMPERPVPEAIMTELSNHVVTLPEGQEQLLADRFSVKRWNRVRTEIKVSGLTFQVLRKTFASLLAQRGVPTAVTQRLLEHSSPQLTNEVYTNVDPVLREAVSLLPVAEWI